MTNKLAKIEKPSPLTAKAAKLWDIGNRAEAKVESLGRDAVPYILVAGAAFHLAKAEVAHGEWEHLITACSPMSLRIIQQRMQSVDSALLKLGIDLEPRAYETIVFSSKIAKARGCALLKTDYARAVIEKIDQALSGRNTHQIELELGIRKPRTIKSSNAPYCTGDYQEDKRNSADWWADEVCADLARLPDQLEWFRPAAENKLREAFKKALRHLGEETPA